MPAILFIEPDRLLAQLYIKALEEGGYQVNWRSSAQNAIELADVETPAAIITELHLSGHSGIEFLYEFRSYPEWQNLPLIILSGVHQQEAGLSASALKSLKVSHFLYKPATSAIKLKKAVESIL